MSLTRWLEDSLWAILPGKLEAIAEVVRRHDAGERLPAPEIAARVGDGQDRGLARRSGSVAVIPVYGILTQRANLLTSFSGGTSTEILTGKVREAAADPSVTAIVLDVDSPGGSVAGIAELSGAVFTARRRKPVVAVANSLMASAAYWVGSQATRVVAAPLSMVGSIGTLMVHVDQSGADEKAGIKVSTVSSGRLKTEGNPHEPLSDEARAHMQSVVDEGYRKFVAAVARGRGIPPRTVRTRSGEGRLMTETDAMGRGLIDGVGTLDEQIRALVK